MLSKILMLSKTLMVSKKNRISVNPENDTIVIRGSNERNGDLSYFIEILRSPIWNTVEAGAKIKLVDFMIDIDDNKMWGSMYCARWMKEKFGDDCIKDCFTVKYDLVNLGGFMGEVVKYHTVYFPII